MMNEELKKQLRNRRICVVIPTYNNDKTIKDSSGEVSALL